MQNILNILHTSFLIYFYLVLYHILYPNHSFPSLMPPIPHPAPPPNSLNLYFSSEKGRALRDMGYHPDMAYQVAVRLCMSPRIKVGQGKLSVREWVSEADGRVGDSVFTTIRSYIGRSSYTTITYVEGLDYTHAGSLLDESVSVSPGSFILRFLVVPLTSLAPTIPLSPL